MRLRAYGVIVSVLVAVGWPLTWDPARDDSFPLSTYPMFSRGKPDPMIFLAYAVAVEEGGERRSIPPELVANAEVLQARAVIARAMRSRRQADALCKRIAGRVAREGGSWSRVAEIRLVTGRHDAVAYLTGADRVGAEKVHMTCPVERPR